MKNLSVIAAIGKNNELGRNNKLIWRTREDMEFFRNKTLNHHIIMGRKTFESLPHTLSNRTNIVITKSDICVPDGIIKYSDINALLRYLEELDDQIFVIGGAQIYSKLIAYVNQIFLTEFDATCSDADTYFPQFDKSKFKETILGSYEEYVENSDEKIKYLRKEYKIKNK